MKFINFLLGIILGILLLLTQIYEGLKKKKKRIEMNYIQYFKSILFHLSSFMFQLFFQSMSFPYP